MENTRHLLYNYLLKSGFNENSASLLNMISLLLIVLVIILLIHYLTKKIIIRIAYHLSEKSKTNFDDLLVLNKVPRNLARIIPVLTALAFTPDVFFDFPYTETLVTKGLQVFGIVLSLWIARSILNTLKDYLKTLPGLKDKPIDSYIQVFMIFAWLVGFLFAFTVITEKSLWKFFAALGTVSAVLILVFKDTLLGFIASIQISINDMVRIGDWITFDKYGADGDVVEINLSTVKVQNFDKTITTIPTYSLISDSFKNWRGMEEAGGRRMKRSLIIKQSMIRYLTKDDISRFERIELISDYIKKRQKDIDRYNREHHIDKSLLINGRNLTNIGVFRKYMETYLEQHAAVNKDMTIMVRQLSPTPQGIPIELYAFSKDKRWENYEYILADIFDHMLASVTYFDLETFERLSGKVKENKGIS